MTAILAFLRRNWTFAAAALAAAILAALLAVRTDQRDELSAALERERHARLLFAERVRAAAERIRADFISHARRVERDRERVSQEISHDYQTRLADLRRRHAELLRRQGAGGPHSGGTDRADLPGLPDPACGPDGAARADGLPGAACPGLALGERLLASEQALRLEALQRWVREQAAVGREVPPPAQGQR